MEAVYLPRGRWTGTGVRVGKKGRGVHKGVGVEVEKRVDVGRGVNVERAGGVTLGVAVNGE